MSILNPFFSSSTISTIPHLKGTITGVIASRTVSLNVLIASLEFVKLITMEKEQYNRETSA